MPREFDTDIRKKWNGPIHNMLKAIDNHTEQYFLTSDNWHLIKAQQLREYVAELKEWIKSKEN